MAKMIKCPTCGTQIEVPPQAAGQIVKCPGCGKGLKLVAKPKPGAGGQQQAGAGAGTGASPGGSMAGGSVSAMTFVGDPPPMDRAGAGLDDMPSLDSSCAVCGRPADPEELVEDNGRLVCGDCIKGARSGMARPEGGAALIDFKPAAAPVRRGKLINLSPAFFLGVLAAIVFLVCSVVLHLELVKKPVGTQTALAGATAGGRRLAATPDDASADPATAAPTEGDTATTPPAPSGGATAATSDDATGTAPPGPSETATGDATSSDLASNDSAGDAPTTPADSGNADAAATENDEPPTTDTAVAMRDPKTSTIFNEDPADTTGGAVAERESETETPIDAPADAPAAPADKPAPAPFVVSSDPLQRGYERLLARDFVKAAQELDQARSRYVIGKLGPAGAALTPEQQMTLEGLAAAYIGQGRFEPARMQLDALYARNVRTRSLTLNLAIYSLNTNRSLADLIKVADFLRQYMGMQQNDETAADIFGTLVNKIARMERAPKEKVEAWWAFHDNYIDQMAARGDAAPAGKLKWGIDWLPAEDVKIYRQARGVTNPGAAVGAAAKEVELAGQRVRSAEIALKNANAARASGGFADVLGAERQLEAANASLANAQKALIEATAAMNVKKPRWLTEYEPVIPQQVAH